MSRSLLKALIVVSLPLFGLATQASAQTSDQGVSQAPGVVKTQQDSVLNGVLIGAAIGAIPGVYWLIADPNECTGLCPEDYVAIGVGALIGGLIDRAIKKKVTVSQARSPKTTKVTISPLVVRHRRGVQVGLTF